jgi:triosephosphate isomerase
MNRPPLRPPVFEIGLKGYAYGAEAVRLAQAADRIAAELGVSVVFDPQAVDIPAVARATAHIHVFAQHLDPVTPGRGVGAMLAEAVREAGADGAMLNHSERPMALGDVERALARAREVSLLTLVYADSPEAAAGLAMLGPDIVLAEPPDLIATERSAATEMRAFVERAIELVGRVDPRVIVMSAAGVQTARDVTTMMALGVGGTGSSSGILRAPDPVARMDEMIRAMHRAWTDLHGGEPVATRDPGGVR